MPWAVPAGMNTASCSPAGCWLTIENGLCAPFNDKHRLIAVVVGLLTCLFSGGNGECYQFTVGAGSDHSAQAATRLPSLVRGTG